MSTLLIESYIISRAKKGVEVTLKLGRHGVLKDGMRPASKFHFLTSYSLNTTSLATNHIS